VGATVVLKRFGIFISISFLDTYLFAVLKIALHP
jgi:hypothetical protein